MLKESGQIDESWSTGRVEREKSEMCKAVKDKSNHSEP